MSTLLFLMILLKTTLAIQIIDTEHERNYNDCRLNEGNLTASLLFLLDPETNSNVVKCLAYLTSRYAALTPVDLTLVSRILKVISAGVACDLYHLVETISNVQKVERSVIADSESSDVILDSVDDIINKQKPFNVAIVADTFMIFACDLLEKNFTGLMLVERNNTRRVELIDGNINIKDLADTQVLSGLILSPQLKQQLNATPTIITVYTTDVLFNPKNSTGVYTIFDLITPGIEEYAGPVSIFGKSHDGHPLGCVHWRKNVHNWMKANSSVRIHLFTTCNFWESGQVALNLEPTDHHEHHTAFLKWMTIINTAISVLSITCIILTAILFKEWRNNSGNQILLNFAFVILFEILMCYLFSIITTDGPACVVIGAIHHYTSVSLYFWMLVIAVLQYRRYVKILGGPPDHILLKSCLFGWGLPVFLVLYVLTADEYRYNSILGVCPPSGLSLYLTVLLPIALILVINIIIFTCIIYSVNCRKADCRVGKTDGMLHWRLAIMLFFMLGLTTLFGFLSEIEQIQGLGYIFWFLSTLRGFFTFLFFVAFNSHTRELHLKLLVTIYRKCQTRQY